MCVQTCTTGAGATRAEPRPPANPLRVSVPRPVGVVDAMAEAASCCADAEERRPRLRSEKPPPPAAKRAAARGDAAAAAARIAGEGDETSVASPRLQLVVNVTLSLHGRGFVLDGGLLLAIRLRDPDGKRPLRSAKVVGSNADSQVKVRNVDGAGENVALEIARSDPRDHGSGARTQREITFKLVAQLYE